MCIFYHSGRNPKCLDQNEDGSCTDNECFCPCDCNKYQVAFKGVPDQKPATLEYIDYERFEICLALKVKIS